MNEEIEKLKLIVPQSAWELGSKVDKHLVDIYDNAVDSFIVPMDEPWFSDGHCKVVLKDSVRDTNAYIFTDICNRSVKYKYYEDPYHAASPNDLAAQLKDIIGACKCHTASLSIIMPLLYAARQHRRNDREPLSCATFLHELDSDSKIKNIIVFDAHSEDVQQALFQTEFDNFYATNYLLEQFIKDTDAYKLKDIIFVAPDNGAAGRMNFYLNSFNSSHIHKEAAIFYKRRDPNRVINGKNPVVEHSYIGRENIEGATAIVIDDMISSGGSMFDVIDTLKSKGVKYIYLITTYALFVEGISKFQQYYATGKFDGLYITNLSYVPEEYRKEEWLHIVDCSEYIAKIIYTLNAKKSISPLLRDKSSPSKALEKKFKNRY